MKEQKVNRVNGSGQTVVEEKYNHLAPAEMTLEENYNQIDGELSNISPGPPPGVRRGQKKREAGTRAQAERRARRHGQARDNRGDRRDRLER